MKKLLFLVFVSFSLGAYFGKTKLSKKPKKKAIEMNVAVAADHVNDQKRFVILVPSYNNSNYCEWNLKSIFSQKYENYRVLYFEDASTDDTLSKVKQIIAKSKMDEKISLIHNEVNQGALANIVKGVGMCDDDEIVVIVDGDDALASKEVLDKLNHYYNNADIWMTYGQFVSVPQYEKGCNVPIKMDDLRNARLRQMTWRTSHLRTFYAGLFKQIRKSDFLYEGKYLEATCDVAMMLPMLEMAREHVAFIPEVLYLYNDENPLADSRVKRERQLFYDRYIRSKPIYDPLKTLLLTEEK